MCPSCMGLGHYLKWLVKQQEAVSPSTRSKRTLPSSKCPLKYLTPRSTKKRRKLARQERQPGAKRIKQLDVNLNEATNEELLTLVTSIQRQSRKELEAILQEADKAGKGDILRAAWKQDVLERLSYEEEQKQNVTGCKGNRWSTITIRMALAVFTRSPKAFEALSSFKLLQLPSASTLKSYVRANREAPGEVEKRLQHERTKYDACVQEHLLAKKQNPPLSKGALIFDEVKVAAKMHWNSKDDSLIGHAMTPEELCTLQDLYMTLDDPKHAKADYILQTLWRDLSSDYDILGPYYTCEGGFPAMFMEACVMDTMRKFESFGFNVQLLICDGASVNLTMLKILMGKQGVFESVPRSHAVLTTFPNPFTGGKVYVMICPSHQLKNMIAALHGSRSGGTNSFERDGVCFGWQAIVDMLKREVQRKETNELPRVPGLKESYVFRDAWTRLNVKPAKIMQQEHVLAELFEYTNRDPAPADKPYVQQTLAYLKACNSMFERGIIGKQAYIQSMTSPVMKNIDSGFQFFSAWADSFLLQDYNITQKSGRKFLAWQTWDLLRVMYYGFRNFCNDFLLQHPRYAIYPARLNGSAVETLFSELKLAAGGHLSSVNYGSARASLVTCRSFQKTTSCDYRQAPLFIRKQQLRRCTKTTIANQK